VIVVVCTYWLIDGTRGMYQHMFLSDLQDRTLDQIVKDHPDMGYVRISGGHFDYSQIVVVEKPGEKIDEAYIPYVSGKERAVTVMASTKDAEILRALNSGEKPPEVTVLQGEIERSGFLNGSSIDEFKGHVELNQPVVVVLHNIAPSFWLTFFEFLAGLVGTGYIGRLIWLFYRGWSSGRPEVAKVVG